MGFFNKAAVFTDLHLGLKSNSKTHNDDCIEYIDWFIDESYKKNCETAIFCGDWNHNRNNINITTLNTGLELLEKIGKNFQQTIFFPGNHDLYYKDRRDMSSVVYGKYIPHITMINEPVVMDEVAFVPWLIGDEWKQIKKMKSRYMFGHFELPHFMMNAMVQMPDHGEIQTEDFKNNEYVFTGHFHKRQSKGNIHYIGNAFPHNFADAWDDDRGMMVLEWGKEPQYINWNDAPRYRTFKLSQLLNDMENLVKPKMYIRVAMDIDIVYEEAKYIKELIIDQYGARDCAMIPERKEFETIEGTEISSFETVDQIVTSQLVNVESNNYDSKVLLEIYNAL